jgi:hypothetical protein
MSHSEASWVGIKGLNVRKGIPRYVCETSGISIPFPLIPSTSKDHRVEDL